MITIKVQVFDDGKLITQTVLPVESDSVFPHTVECFWNELDTVHIDTRLRRHRDRDGKPYSVTVTPATLRA